MANQEFQRFLILTHERMWKHWITIKKLDDLIIEVRKVLEYVDYNSTRLLHILHELHSEREDEIWMYQAAKAYVDDNTLYTP